MTTRKNMRLWLRRKLNLSFFLILSWQASPDQDLAGYLIHETILPSAKIKTFASPATSTQLELNFPCNAIIKYQVQAYDTAGNKSKPSAPLYLSCFAAVGADSK